MIKRNLIIGKGFALATTQDDIKPQKIDSIELDLPTNQHQEIVSLLKQIAVFETIDESTIEINLLKRKILEIALNHVVKESDGTKIRNILSKK